MLAEISRKYLYLRQSHPAWLLLTSRRAPLVLGCLKAVFDEQGEILVEDVAQRLGDLFGEYANVEEFEIERGKSYALCPLLMTREVFQRHQGKAVVESVNAPEGKGLTKDEGCLLEWLGSLERGRLEQEFLERDAVEQAVQAWVCDWS